MPQNARTSRIAATAAAALASAVLLGCAATAPPSAPPAKPVPAYLNDPRGCAILAGGSVGSRFGEAKVASFWHEVNKQIAEQLQAELARAGYRSILLVIAPADTSNAERLVVTAMARERCSRILQVAHTAGEDAQGRFFRYDVTVMRAQPSGPRPPSANGTAVHTVGEYERAYRYPRTEETFKSFFTGVFASTVFTDLEASGALRSLKEVKP